jgi:imidazolonepropionase-like amidohydrolase
MNGNSSGLRAATVKFAAVAGAALFLAVSAGARPPETSLVLRGVTVVDLEQGARRSGQTIQIAASQIVAVGPDTDGAYGTAKVVEAAGRFVIPGLWDAHAHLSYWGEDALERLVGHGVTTIRELGGDPDEIEGWMKEIEAGTRVGPKMFWSGPFFEGPEGDDEYRWKVASVAQAQQRADELFDRGVDFLKIQPKISAELTAALVAAAAARGSSVVGHVPVGLSAIDAANLGLRSIEHLSPYLRLSDVELEATIAVLLERNVWVSPALYSMVAQSDARGDSRADSELIQRAYGLVRRFAATGVPMLVGANFAYRDWPHRPGSALHGEMEVLVEAGIAPAAVLHMTTFGNAQFLGVDPAAVRIAAGGQADLVLLGADPLADISATRYIEGAVLRGTYMDGAALAGLRQDTMALMKSRARPTVGASRAPMRAVSIR